MIQIAALTSRLFLSILLVVTSAPLTLTPLNTAFAQEVPTSDEKSIDQEVEDLKATFLDPENTSANLDPFNLTKQAVIDDRGQNVEAVITNTIQEDHHERIEYFEGEISELEDLKNQIEIKLTQETDDKKINDLKNGMADLESRQRIAEIELEDLAAFDPKKGQALPVDHMVDQELRTRHHFGRNLDVIFNYENGQTHKVNQRDFSQSLSPDAQIENPVHQSAKFEIANKKGVVYHKFFQDVEALFFYGQYLVYVEKSSYDSERKVQDLKFIDLNYFRTSVGNAPLPVFTLPVKHSQTPSSYSIENGYLKIGEQKLSHPQLDILAKTQRVMFNVNAALVDPSTYDNAKPLIDEISEFFETSMKGQEQLFQEQMHKALSSPSLLAQAATDLKAVTPVDSDATKKLIAAALEDTKITDAEYEKISTALDSRANLTAANISLHASRKLMTRINLLVRFLIRPRPEGVPHIFRALLVTATGTSEDRARVLEFTKKSFAFKVAKYGVTAGGTLLAAATLSPFVRDQLSQSLDLISAVHQHYIGYLEHIDYGRHYVELSKDAVITSVSGWTYIFESYLSDGKWTKFLHGLGSVLMIPVKLFASVHFSVNTYKMFKKTREYRAKLSSRVRVNFIRAFIKAAELENASYWNNRAEAEKKVSGSDVNDMTDEDIRLLDEHLERLKRNSSSVLDAKEELGLVKLRKMKRFKKGFKETLKQASSILSYAKYLTGHIKNLVSKLNLQSDSGVIKGLSNAFFSYSALTSTFKTNSNIWNVLYVARSFAFSPAKWLMFVIYPNYFHRAVSQESKKQHFPSKYNGGLELWTQKLRRLPVGERINKLSRGYFLSKEALEGLRTFENEVAKIEALAMELSFKKAQIALIERIDDPEKLLSLLDSKANVDSLTGQATVTTGIQSLHDPKIKTLSKTDRLFFRAYYTRTFDSAMQAFILKVSNIDESIRTDPADFAKTFAEELKSNSSLEINLSEDSAKDFSKSIESSLDFSAIGAWSEKMVRGGEKFIDKLNVNYRHKLLGTIHPGNGQIKRFLTAREKVQDPRAMGRATREEVTGLVSSIPIGILSTLALYAGVQSGVLQPFDAAGLNSETHYLYMSRYLFYNGFIPGLIIGLMANTWMKVQTDARIDAVGGFDKAIKFSDSKKGFWRYYVKNFFKHPSNKWKANHIFMLKLIWSNIPAAAVTILVAQSYGLGRIDPGIIMSGYVMVFASVLVGLNTKTNQAFELATSWVFDKIPRRFRAHPKAQKYIELQTQKRRIFFGWFENLWEIIVQENIAGDMLTLKDNPSMGTRSFFRLMFGGDTPTEILVNFADKLKISLAAVPGVESVLETFKKWISKGFEAFDRYPVGFPESAERLVENPDLPKSFLGEFFGKLGGMIVSIGTFTGAPYVITDQLERQNERSIQRRGEKVRAQGSAMSCGSFL